MYYLYHFIKIKQRLSILFSSFRSKSALFFVVETSIVTSFLAATLSLKSFRRVMCLLERIL